MHTQTTKRDRQCNLMVDKGSFDAGIAYINEGQGRSAERWLLRLCTHYFSCVEGGETGDEPRVQTQKRDNLYRRRQRGYTYEYSRLVEQAISGYAQGTATTTVGHLTCYGNHLSLEIPRIPNSGQDREQTPM